MTNLSEESLALLVHELYGLARGGQRTRLQAKKIMLLQIKRFLSFHGVKYLPRA
jgi:hypothetical protein